MLVNKNLHLTFYFFLLMMMKAHSQPYCPRMFYLQSINTAELNSDYYKTIQNYFLTKNQVITGDFNGFDKEEVLLINYYTKNNSSQFHLSLFSYCPAQMKKIWNNILFNNGEAFFEWIINVDDNYVTGDFDGDGKDGLLCINPNGWSKLYNYTGNSCDFASNQEEDWEKKWSNSGSGQIANWVINSDDIYFSGDFDSDGKDELLCINPNGWWHLLDYYKKAFRHKKGNGGSGNIGGFVLEHIKEPLSAVGKFVHNENRDMLFLANYGNQESPGWYALNYFNGYDFVNKYTNFGVDKIGSQRINAADHFYAINLDTNSPSSPQNNTDELIRLNRAWRNEILSIDYFDSFNTPGFDVNGNILFDYNLGPNSFPPIPNPKYFEVFRPVFGHFLTPSKGSVLIFCSNESVNYQWGKNVYVMHPENNDVNWLTGNPNELETEIDVYSRNTRQEENTVAPDLNQNLRVFPNPATNFITIQISGALEIKDSFITNTSGNKVKDLNHYLNNLDHHSSKISIEHLPPGMYFIVLKTDQGLFTKKLIIHQL